MRASVWGFLVEEDQVSVSGAALSEAPPGTQVEVALVLDGLKHVVSIVVFEGLDARLQDQLLLPGLIQVLLQITRETLKVLHILKFDIDKAH